MKKGLIILASIALFSCKKEWKCEVTVNGETTGTTYFKGTKEEMKAYEQAGTKTVIGNEIKTECK